MSFKDAIGDIFGSDDVLIKLDSFLSNREGDDRSGWHPSDFCGMCPRARVLERLYGVKGSAISPTLHRIFDTGHALHEWYQNKYFGEMRILWGPWRCLKCDEIHWGLKPISCCGAQEFNYEELGVVHHPEGCKDRINGHIDGIIKIRGLWYILEIKTINSNGFKWLGVKPKEAHGRQAQIYANLVLGGHADVPEGVQVPMPKGIIFLYISKDDSVLRSYVVDIDLQSSDLELEKPSVVDQAIEKKVLPARLDDCESKSSKRAKKCKCSKMCFTGWDFEEHSVIADNCN